MDSVQKVLTSLRRRFRSTTSLANYLAQQGCKGQVASWYHDPLGQLLHKQTGLKIGVTEEKIFYGERSVKEHSIENRGVTSSFAKDFDQKRFPLLIES